MPRHTWLAVAVAACLSFVNLPYAAADTTDFATVMPDPAYRSCVTSALGLSADAQPSTADLESLTTLSCTQRGIVDLTGTGSLPNLGKLFVGGNAITDLTALAHSTKLFSLGVENNAITSVSALAGLANLSSVGLAGNQLRDLAILGTLGAYDAGHGTRHGQHVTTAAATNVPGVVPTVIGASGTPFTAEAPEDPNVSVSGRSVTYLSPGNYTWTFRDPQDFYFNGTITVTVTDSGVTIPDSALRACVNSKLGNTDAGAQPSLSQLAAATGTLTCTAKGIVDLTGLELMTGLTGLSLKDNAITDVSPISVLTGLTTLRLDRNQFTNIAALGDALTKVMTVELQQSATSTKTKLATLVGINKLTALTSLTINYTAVSSLAPLAGNQSLKTLTATNIPVSDVSPLASTGTQLASVDLSADRIGDLSSLASHSFTKLTVNGQVLSAASAVATQPITAPSVIKKDGSTLVATAPDGVSVDQGTVTYASAGSYAWTFAFTDSLTGVQFGGTITQLVTDPPPPVVGVDLPDAGLKSCLAELLGQDAAAAITADQLAGLTTVSCVNKGITDLTGSEKLTGATELVLSTNQVTDLRPLSGLTGLKKLSLAGNAVTDPSPLANLTGLETLNLSYNPISSISSLAPLVHLSDFELTQKSGHTGADLTSLDGVQTMTRLTRLVANNSSITDLGPVAELHALQRLFVNHNQISDLTPVSDLTELTALGANSNQIRDVSALAKLTKLTDLDLATNQVLDLSPLTSLTNLGYLGLKARWQQITLTSVPAKLHVTTPTPRDPSGAVVTLTAPSDVTPASGKVRYPSEGSYRWTFTTSSAEGEYFSGTITQPVTAPVEGVADVPDNAFRACLATAAGLESAEVPTQAQLAALTQVDCHSAGITDLTGAEELTHATSLNLSHNPLSSTAALAGLSSLTVLDLSDTGLSSLTDLAGLRGLTTLTLDDNKLRDLSALSSLSGLDHLSATGQHLSASATPGGVEVSAPSVITVAGKAVAATAPQAATTTSNGARFSRAGSYRWTFEVGSFSGWFTQVVTSDEVDTRANNGAAACVTAGKVWVSIERDTGLQEGGCAARFATGLEALSSAGFTTSGSGLITAINGYPTSGKTEGYWSYWHAAAPTKNGNTTSYRWEYANTGPGSYVPSPGAIEGWRYVTTQDVAPSWQPVIADLSPGNLITTSLTATAARTSYGKPIPITVRVSPATAGGTVSAVVGGKTLTGAVKAGVATITVPAGAVGAGTSRLSLSYRGDATHKASSTAVSLVVSKAKPKISAKVVSKQIRRGGSAVIAVRVSGPRPATGTVTVVLSGRRVSVRLDRNGQARVQVNKLRWAGKRPAEISYGGDKNHTRAVTTLAVKIKRH